MTGISGLATLSELSAGKLDQSAARDEQENTDRDE
jgi:hypothetical protein